MKFLKIILAIPLLFLAGWVAFIALYAAVLILGGWVGGAYEGVFGIESDRKVQTHVTIYVDTQLQRDGGMVTVSALPVDEQQWLQISLAAKRSNNNLAMLDPTNLKQKKVKPGDLHGGVIISSAASSVEIYYPKTGSYTYNFLSLPKASASMSEPTSKQLETRLETKVVSAGSSSLLRDPETGGQMDWPSVNVLAIMGSKRGESWARGADYQFSSIDEKDFSQAYKITKSPVTRVMQVTEFGLKKYFRCLPPVSCEQK